MKTISKLFGAVAAIAALAACNKEADFKPVVSEGMQRITIKVNAPDTKVMLDTDPYNPGGFLWSANETLIVKCEGDATERIFTMVSEGNFTGEIPVGATISDVYSVVSPDNEYIVKLNELEPKGMQPEYTFDTDVEFPFQLHWTPAYGGDFETGITLYPDSFVFLRGNLGGVKVYWDGVDYGYCYIDLIVRGKRNEGEDEYEKSFRLYLAESNINPDDFFGYANYDEEADKYYYTFSESDEKYYTFFLNLDAYDLLENPTFYAVEEGEEVLLGHTSLSAGFPSGIATIWGVGAEPSRESNRYMIRRYAFNMTHFPVNDFAISDGDLNDGSVAYGFTWGDLNDGVLESREIIKMSGAEILSQYDPDGDIDEDATYFFYGSEEDTRLLRYCGEEYLTTESAFVDWKEVEATYIAPKSPEVEGILIDSEGESTDTIWENHRGKGSNFEVTLDSNGLYVVSSHVACSVDGAEVYGCSIEEDKVVLSEDSYQTFPANTAVILKGEAGSTVTISPLNGEADEISSALTPSILITVVEPNTVYVLSADEEGNPVFKLFSGSETKALSGYLEGWV